MKLLISKKQLGFFHNQTVYWYTSLFQRNDLNQMTLDFHIISTETIVL